jgi:dolichol-phosphate mannosyltransferase
MSKKKSLVSFVLPAYNEAKTLPEFHKVLSKTLQKHEKEFGHELIFINDGSRDNTLEILKNLRKKDKSVKIINFSRNFGQQMAVTAGLDFAGGDAVIIMDCDLQDPPAVVIQMLAKWREGFEVVYGQRRTRKDTMFKKTTASIFYKVIDWLTDFDIPRNTGDFRLMDRKVVDTIKKFPERNRFMRGMISFVGFKQTPLLFDRDERFAGETNYPFKKMFRLAMDGILGFSTVPLRLMTYIGLVVSFFSFIGILYAVGMYVFFPQITVPGWTLMMTAILFIGGIQMVMLGVLGEYIGRIYSEVQGRPLYIIDEVIGN